MSSQVPFDCQDGTVICLELGQFCDGIYNCQFSGRDESEEMCPVEPSTTFPGK